MRTRRVVALGTAALAAAALVSACSSSGGDNGGSGSSGKVTLQFQSLAFQKPTIAAVKGIVDSWNSAHPNIQVKLNQGSWDSVHDQLVTQFAGGTAPDIIQDDAADISGFISQGYLADLSGDLSSSVKSSVPQGSWDTVSQDGKIYAAPYLLQSYVVFANTDLLKTDGITVPSGATMSWDDLQSMAKQATKGGAYGLGWGLKSPTATMMTLGLNFDGTYFSGSGQDAKISVGDNENQVPERIHAMAYDDKSIDPTSLTQSGTDVLPSFYAGKQAMIVGGNYVAQQISEEAPKSFHWTVLPPLAGTSADQAADPQVLAVSQASKHVKEATEFIDYFMAADNLAKVAMGDWLIPTTDAARAAVQKATGGANGWTQTLAGAKYQVSAPFQTATNYPQWKDQIATPAFQQYLANKISLQDLDQKLTDGWSQVNQ
ncbi:MAG TPA: extracellular solute-binding protein [Jatrophihabitantaceae bacterium]|jgi:ABC-type glycerol-3-phosphate transport system substrate-binding protein|nr:extracellular solute-binding protein [Jatrophihabitantaceae bacterium]